MSFTTYCDINVNNPDTPIQLAGCGILLVHRDEDLKESNARTFQYGLSSNNAYCASLITMRLALSSIKPSYRKQKTTLYVSKVIYDTWQNEKRRLDLKEADGSDDSAWVEKCREEIHRWISYYPDLAIKGYDGGEHSELLINLAKQGCETQTQGDSGTIYWE
ncbi:hypothetical protein N9045_01565 [bacterium]|nr:hypothetical protein [bacterium]